MPPVASEASTPAYPPSLPNPGWSAPSSGRAPEQPFETLLNDGGQPANDPPPPASPPPSDKTQPVAQADQSAAPAKTADASAPQANDATHPAPAGTTIQACQPADLAATVLKAVSTDKPVTKTADQVAGTDDPKPATVNKATDSLIAADPTATNSNQTAIPAVAVTIAIAAALPPAMALQAAIAVAENPPTNSGSDTTVLVKTASASQAGGKAQQAAGETDKLTASPVHGEAPDNSRHIVAAETPPAITADAQSTAPKITADAAQPVAFSAPPQNVAAAANPAAPAPQAPQALAVPLAGVAIEIAGKALAGKNRFEIRLDPPELGRIDVRLDVDRDGNTTTHLIADRSDTLNLMQRDSAGLERALQDAGLKTADNGLQFSLRDQTMGRDPNNTPTPGAAQIVVQDDLLAGADLPQRHYSRLAGLGGGIDIRV